MATTPGAAASISCCWVGGLGTTGVGRIVSPQPATTAAAESTAASLHFLMPSAFLVRSGSAETVRDGDCGRLSRTLLRHPHEADGLAGLPDHARHLVAVVALDGLVA